MRFETQVSGFSFVCITDYEKALMNLKEVCSSIDPLRTALLHDLRQLQQQDKNTFAKSVRLLDRFSKQVEELCRIQL